MNTQLTFGAQQIHTSKRMLSYPGLGKLFYKLMGYTNVGNYARFTIFKDLIHRVNLQPNSKVLDLGTGYGEYSFSLAQADPSLEVHALDIDKDRIATVEKAVQKSDCNNIKTHCKYIHELREQNFDLIFSVDVFEHILPQEMPFAMAYQKLKPGGHMVVKIPNKTQKTILPEDWFEDHNDWLEDEHIGQVYDLKGLRRRFEEEGFEVVYSSYSDGWLSRFAWELAYLGKKPGIVSQLLTLPIAKALIHLDRLVHGGNWGNAIQVVGQKKQA